MLHAVSVLRCLVFNFTDHVTLSVVVLVTVMPSFFFFGLLHYVLEGAALLIFCFFFVFLPTVNPLHIAEHLGIEFMGMEQSILILSS